MRVMLAIFYKSDIEIPMFINYFDKCYILNDGTNFECHPEYKSSLFVNTNEPEYPNNFTILDFEVYYRDFIFDECTVI